MTQITYRDPDSGARTGLWVGFVGKGPECPAEECDLAAAGYVPAAKLEAAHVELEQLRQEVNLWRENIAPFKDAQEELLRENLDKARAQLRDLTAERDSYLENSTNLLRWGKELAGFVQQLVEANRARPHHAILATMTRLICIEESAIRSKPSADDAKKVVAEFVEERKEQLSRAYDSPLAQAARGYKPPADSDPRLADAMANPPGPRHTKLKDYVGSDGQDWWCPECEKAGRLDPWDHLFKNYNTREEAILSCATCKGTGRNVQHEQANEVSSSVTSAASAEIDRLKSELAQPWKEAQEWQTKFDAKCVENADLFEELRREKEQLAWALRGRDSGPSGQKAESRNEPGNDRSSLGQGARELDGDEARSGRDDTQARERRGVDGAVFGAERRGEGIGPRNSQDGVNGSGGAGAAEVIPSPLGASADPGAAKPREAADECEAASDNPGGGAGGSPPSSIMPFDNKATTESISATEFTKRVADLFRVGADGFPYMSHVDILIEIQRLQRSDHNIRRIADQRVLVNWGEYRDRCLKEPTLVAALSMASIWDTENAVRQAMRNAPEDKRPGGLWDTFSASYFREILEKWPGKPRVNGLHDPVIYDKYQDLRDGIEASVTGHGFQSKFALEHGNLLSSISTLFDGNHPALKKPMELLLSCPVCHVRHIDVGEFATKPHHTHACQGCGHVWRPAKEPTVGVQYLDGYKNAPSGAELVGKRVRVRADALRNATQVGHMAPDATHLITKFDGPYADQSQERYHVLLGICELHLRREEFETL